MMKHLEIALLTLVLILACGTGEALALKFEFAGYLGNSGPLTIRFLVV